MNFARKYVVKADCIHFLAQAVAGSCEHGNELSGPIKDGEFLD
jgi:hypothetical protein